MYAFIEGKVCEKNAGELILLAGGVGYQINCSMNTLAAAPAVGETMRCYTWLSVREDAMELFGFPRGTPHVPVSHRRDRRGR